jgi:transcription elongation factor GreA
MTIEGAQRLTAELEQLEKVDRAEIIRAISEAREHGDLKENAEYHAAKEKQGFIEARIRDIKQKISHAHVVDLSQITNNGVVVFGASVTLYNLNTEEEVRYKIVGEDEANVKEKKISIASPVARALIGKAVGEEVEVHTPAGVVVFEIITVDYV